MPVILATLFSLLLALPAAARSIILPADPADFSQISDFHADWCARSVEPVNEASSLCFGHSRFQSTDSIRSVLVQRRNGEKDLYVEDEWPVVELLKPRFGLVGPVLPSTVAVEKGEAALFLDTNTGNETGLELSLPSLGEIRALR